MGGLERGYNRRQSTDRDRRPPPGWDSAFSPGMVDKDGVYWAVDKWKYGGVLGPVSSKMLEDHVRLEKHEAELEEEKHAGLR